MNILWINNIAIPQIAEILGDKSVPVGGWMVKLADEMSSIPEIHLSIAFPYHAEKNGATKDFDFYSFVISEKQVLMGNILSAEKRIVEIIKIVHPDVIHIFGTEGAHSYVVSEVCAKNGFSDRIVVSIQGLVSVYWKHYTAFLSNKVVIGRTLRDILKGNIEQRSKRLKKLGSLEEKTLKNAKHIIGRTEWDKACTYWVNPEAHYHFNNEMLRDSFYGSAKWDVHNCERYSIFFSQATSPIKGLHLMLEALVLLKKEYPNVKLYVAGKSYAEKEKIKLSYYEKYILDNIEKNNLQQNVKFTGFLNEQEMALRFLCSHVFVSASSIENSPNSVCEAMYLGVPIISSMVGGVVDLFEHGKEGIYYQADAPYMLAYGIKKVFSDDLWANNLSKNAILRAENRHKVEDIVRDLVGIYREICD